jgi:hypothetical protein
LVTCQHGPPALDDFLDLAAAMQMRRRNFASSISPPTVSIRIACLAQVFARPDSAAVRDP